MDKGATVSAITLKQYTTALENATRETMREILERKTQEVGAAGLADYVALTTENIENRIERIDVAIAELQAMKKAAHGQKEIVREAVADFLMAAGVERLEGDRVSSITVYMPKPKHKVVVLDKEAAIESGFAKVTVDTTALKNALENGEEIPEEVATIETVVEPPKIKINKRRA